MEGDDQSDPIRVGFVRSGGFGGLRLATELDADELTEAEVALLRTLLSGGGDGRAGTAPAAPRGADRFRYDLTIHAGEGSRTLSLSEADLTPELRPLVDRLEAHARKRG